MADTAWRRIGFAALAAVLVAGPATGADRLRLGDPAPPIPATVEWLQGEAIERLDDGRVYAIDFWATWCGPCIASIPEVQAMHEALREQGVVVIGAHIWATEAAPTPQAFLEEIGGGMTYPIAVDRDGSLARDFMEAAGQDGIPTMMVVDRKGRIAWIGHPMDGARSIVERIVAGTFDIEEAQENLRRRVEAAAAAALANRMALDGDWEGAFREIDRALELDPERQRKLAVLKVQRMALTLRREEEAYAYGRTIVDGVIADDAALLHNLARFIVEAPGLEQRDLTLARRAAMRALELSKDSFADAMATMASIEFAEGRLEQAVDMQRRALALAQSQAPELVREFEKELAAYEAAWNAQKPPPF